FKEFEAWLNERNANPFAGIVGGTGVEMASLTVKSLMQLLSRQVGYKQPQTTPPTVPSNAMLTEETYVAQNRVPVPASIGPGCFATCRLLLIAADCGWLLSAVVDGG
ncbi:unnamed protein product, partial [Prunus brigantina]